MSGSRDRFGDAVKRGGYLLVLVGHLDATKYIFNFHMPLFFIVPGMYFSESSGVKRVLRNVAVPWLYFGAVCMVLSFVFTQNIHLSQLIKTSILGRPYVCNSLWFLTALLVVQLLAICHQRLNGKVRSDDLLFIGELVACLLLGWTASRLSGGRFFYHCPMMLLSVPMAYFFFIIGYRLKNVAKQVPILFCRCNAAIVLLVLICVYGSISYCFGYSNMFYPIFDSLPVYVILAILGTFSIVLFCRVVQCNDVLRGLAWVGRYSVAFFLIEEYSIRLSVKLVRQLWPAVKSPVYSMPTNIETLGWKILIAVVAFCISLMVVPVLMKGLGVCKDFFDMFDVKRNKMEIKK